MAHRLFISASAAILGVTFVSVAHSAEGAGQHAEPAWWLIALFTAQGMIIWLFARQRYLVWKEGELKPAFSELQEFSSYLLSGAIIAQLWIHGDAESYRATVHDVLWAIPWLQIDVSLHFLANEVLMSFFFGIAAKELAEATLKKQGALRGMKGFLPLMACAGGVIVPAIVYLRICTPDMTRAWAVPCATDIAFAWLGARAIWGVKHPAVTFLLAIAVADDFIGMGVIAIFYPQRSFNSIGILLLVLGMGMAFANNRAAKRVVFFGRWQAFVIPGAICWFGLHLAGLHAALALVFVVPWIPMRDEEQGLFSEKEKATPDSISLFEQAHKPFVDMGLFYFGLANAGVAWWATESWDRNSWAVFLGLGIGKTIGITTFTLIGFLLLKIVAGAALLPINVETKERLYWQDVPLAGLLGATGFTVALFVAEAAGGQASLKLGALSSFVFLGFAVALGKLMVASRK